MLSIRHSFTKSCNYSNRYASTIFDLQPPRHSRRRRHHKQISGQWSDASCRHLSHFVCLKDWDRQKVLHLICDALDLKHEFGDTHGTKTNLLSDYKVMLLEDHREPLERLALSKAISLLGADEVHITSKIEWNHDYYGRVFSEMADAIFMSSNVHGCIRQFSKFSAVPVIVMRSRIHCSILSLATIMSIMEEYCNLEGLNVAYIGAPHQVINDYLLLCPMLKANFMFKCSCTSCPVSPLRLEDGKCKCDHSHTVVNQTSDTKQVLKNADVIISGPATMKKDKVKEFHFTLKDIQKNASPYWTYYHTLPRGKETEDEVFWHKNARSFNAIKNMQFICAALIINHLQFRETHCCCP